MCLLVTDSTALFNKNDDQIGLNNLFCRSRVRKNSQCQGGYDIPGEQFTLLNDGNFGGSSSGNGMCRHEDHDESVFCVNTLDQKEVRAVSAQRAPKQQEQEIQKDDAVPKMQACPEFRS